MLLTLWLAVVVVGGGGGGGGGGGVALCVGVVVTIAEPRVNCHHIGQCRKPVAVQYETMA